MIPTAEGVVHEMVHAAPADSLSERFCEEIRHVHAAGAPVAESDRQEAVDPRRLTKTFVYDLLEEAFTSGAPTLWQFERWFHGACIPRQDVSTGEPYAVRACEARLNSPSTSASVASVRPRRTSSRTCSGWPRRTATGATGARSARRSPGA